MQQMYDCALARTRPVLGSRSSATTARLCMRSPLGPSYTQQSFHTWCAPSHFAMGAKAWEWLSSRGMKSRGTNRWSFVPRTNSWELITHCQQHHAHGRKLLCTLYVQPNRGRAARHTLRSGESLPSASSWRHDNFSRAGCRGKIAGTMLSSVGSPSFVFNTSAAPRS